MNEDITVQDHADETITPSQATVVSSEHVDAAAQTWRENTTTPEMGNHGLLELAVGLAKAGLDEATIRTTLKLEAHHARRPRDRLRQIPSIMASLKRYGRMK